MQNLNALTDVPDRRVRQKCESRKPCCQSRIIPAGRGTRPTFAACTVAAQPLPPAKGGTVLGSNPDVPRGKSFLPCECPLEWTSSQIGGKIYVMGQAEGPKIYVMGQAEGPKCPHCGAYLTLALRPGGRG